MRKLLGISLIFLFTSCTTRNPTYTQQFHYHDDGVPKPKVAMVPVYDKSHAEMPWNLSHELTEAFEEKIFLSGKFYMTTDFEMLGVNRLPLQEINPFLDDISWLGEVDTGTEFIIFIELVQHNLTPTNGESGFKLFQTYSLDVAMRIKVIDLREKKPKVILQELVQGNYYIPWRFSSIDYQKGGWNKKAFALSPIGMAHGKIIKRIAKQVEDYIMLAKLH